MTRRISGVLLLTCALVACGDDAAIVTTTAVASTTTTVAATTTAAPTTTATTTTTSTTTTTTTTPPEPEIRFLPNGLDWFDFGADADTVIAAAAARFGAPSSDTGWLAGGFGDYGVCPGTEFRQLAYLDDTLTLMFSDVDYFVPGGVRNFIYYAYHSPSGTTLTDGPPASIDIGTTVAQLLAIYPAAEVVGDDPLFGPSFSYRPGSGFEGIYGSLTGTADTDTITYLSGGVGCGE